MVYEKKYSWRAGKSVPAHVAGKVMAEIEKRDGVVTKETFLEASRPEDSPTHGLFEWEDSVAAEKYRLEQSRIAIQDIVVTIVKSDEKAKTHAFVNVVAGKGNPAKYVSMDVAMEDDTKRKIVLENALEELESFERKYSMYNELAKIFSEIHKLRKTL